MCYYSCLNYESKCYKIESLFRPISADECELAIWDVWHEVMTLQPPTMKDDNCRILSCIYICLCFQNIAVWIINVCISSFFTQHKSWQTKAKWILMQLLPSGKTMPIFRTDIRLFMSLRMLSATPGYWKECENNTWNQSRRRLRRRPKKNEYLDLHGDFSAVF